MHYMVTSVLTPVSCTMCVAILSRAKYQNLAGTRSSLDVAEIPSVLMENLLLHTELVDFDKNSQFTRWQESKRLEDAANSSMQRKIAYIDLALHSTMDIRNVMDIKSVVRRYLGTKHGTTSFLVNFMHFTTYGGSYFSYLFVRNIVDV